MVNNPDKYLSSKEKRKAYMKKYMARYRKEHKFELNNKQRIRNKFSKYLRSENINKLNKYDAKLTTIDNLRKELLNKLNEIHKYIANEKQSVAETIKTAKEYNKKNKK